LAQDTPLAGEKVSDVFLAELSSEAGISNATGAGTSTSASYANITATPSSFSFTKYGTNSRLRAQIAFDSFSTVLGTKMSVAVQILGTDYELKQHWHTNANLYTAAVSVAYISGLPAGTYTVQVRWSRVSGTGTLTTDANGWIACSVSEVT